MRVMVLIVAASAIAVLPSGAARASFPLEPQCPMPVRVPDSATAERMPVVRWNTAIPMPTQLPQCSNSLFARRDSAAAGVLPNQRLEPSRR